MEIQAITIVGAGQMGTGIAQVCAAAGYAVFLNDVDPERSKDAVGKIAHVMSKLVDKGKLAADERDALLARITPGATLAGLPDSQLMVEAVTEARELKCELFRQADTLMPEGAILATNTSSISITRLAAETARPERVIGMHFMNPPPLMKLVEVVLGVQTSPETLETVRQLAQTLGKSVITSKDRPGFMVNRLLVPFLNEACFALQEGLGSLEDIDQGARLGLNHPMGPLELADLIGLDTLLSITEVLHREFGDDKYRPPTLLRNLVAAGWLGRKAGRGFYLYDARGQRTGPALERF